MEFSKDGICRREGYGLYYEGEDGYELYESTQVDGVQVKTKFLAIFNNKVISRHNVRPAAIRSCATHRNQNKKIKPIHRRKTKIKRGH
jgi:hypothetical protein